MSFLTGIFGAAPKADNNPAPAPAAASAAPAAGPALRQAAPANPGANPDSMVVQPAGQPAAGSPVNPLDAFTDMFKARAADPNAPKVPTLADPILGAFDANAFQQQVSQANFAAAVPQETIQKAMQGDATAFAEALNVAAREAFAAATKLSHGLVEHGSRTAAERVDRNVDARVRNHMIRTHNPDNAILQHPAVAPMVDGVKGQIARANPQLTPAQVVDQAAAYFQTFADSFTASKAPAPSAQNSGPRETDFSAYLD